MGKIPQERISGVSCGVAVDREVVARVDGHEQTTSQAFSRGLTVRSDPALLRQILHNLLGNAIRHGKGEIRLEARAVDEGRHARFAIRNRIAGGDTPLLGTGMGLRLVRAIVGTLGETTFQAEERDGVFEAVLELPGG